MKHPIGCLFSPVLKYLMKYLIKIINPVVTKNTIISAASTAAYEVGEASYFWLLIPELETTLEFYLTHLRNSNLLRAIGMR